MYYYQPERFVQDKAILRSVNYDSNTTVIMEAANVGFNSKMVKAVTGGLFLAKAGAVNRYLPRAKTTAAVTTGQALVPVTMPELFLAGDQVRTFERLATLTVGGTLVVGENVFVSYKGQTVSYTFTSTVAATEAAGLLAALQASSLSLYFRFTSGGGAVINVYSTLSDNEELSVAVQSVAATFVLSAFAEGAFIGTVSSVDSANSRLVLSANAAVAVPSGAIVAVAVDQVYGLNIHSNDYTYKPTLHLNAITGAAGVYKAALPYIDNSLIELFPKLHIS
jgi:hypothetical protein